eukprot:230576-Chlamydomonas_euryale.AAC.2
MDGWWRRNVWEGNVWEGNVWERAYRRLCDVDLRKAATASAAFDSSAGLGKMAVTVRMISYVSALPIAWLPLARRIVAPITVYMFSDAARSPAPSSARILSSLICQVCVCVCTQVEGEGGAWGHVDGDVYAWGWTCGGLDVRGVGRAG